MKDIGPAYNFKEVESRIYAEWEKSGFFNPDNLPASNTKPFTIIMPPPNANGPLHIGHAVFVTLQDIMIRFARMTGKKALWLPGADHAGFETQVVYDKKLDKEGRNRYEIPREQLWKEIYDFTMQNKHIMEGQLRSLGASCDWSRGMFTLDPDVIAVVYETFKKLYDDGLAYRAERIVNWCARHQTSLSELEVAQPEVVDILYYLQYGPFVIATARPETKFGDKYVVVHPKDKRYAQYHNGEQFEVEWINGRITATLIKDDIIDMKFGTGAMTITPWHDVTDFEIAQRHNVPKEQIIDWKGRLLDIAGEFSGQHISKARPLIVEKLKAKKLLVKIEEGYKHIVPACYKCNTPIEPQVRPQWFIKIEPLAKEAMKALQEKKISILPKRSEKVYMHWLKNIRDWNISRQIVWGIRIPAWFRGDEIYVGEKPPEGDGWTQDPDVFDTWFSSGQWPFATFMALDRKDTSKKDFKTFYPTDVMETGYDILFFWVIRMVMLGIYRTGNVPFQKVYLHGLVRDKDRQKMSKSKGNVIDPLAMVDMYGGDALRMALVIGNTAGNDAVISEDKIRGYRNFATKVWNIARFVLMNVGDDVPAKPAYSTSDKKYLTEVKKIKISVKKDLEAMKFHHAGEKVYHYIWHTFADKIIEEVKPRLVAEHNENKIAAQATILTLLRESLVMLHPFMPFVTEAIWNTMPNRNNQLIIEQW